MYTVAIAFLIAYGSAFQPGFKSQTRFARTLAMTTTDSSIATHLASVSAFYFNKKNFLIVFDCYRQLVIPVVLLLIQFHRLVEVACFES